MTTATNLDCVFVENAPPNVVSNIGGGGLDPLPLYATTLLSADVDRMENWILLNNNKEFTVYNFPFFSTHAGSGAGSGTAGSGTGGGSGSSNRASGTGNESSSHHYSESSIAGGVGESVVTGMVTLTQFDSVGFSQSLQSWYPQP